MEFVQLCLQPLIRQLYPNRRNLPSLIGDVLPDLFDRVWGRGDSLELLVVFFGIVIGTLNLYQ